MVMMSVTEMTMCPSQVCSGRRPVGVSCHTIWYLTVVGGVRAVRDGGWVGGSMLSISCEVVWIGRN